MPSRPAWVAFGGNMSKNDAILLASRALAVLLTVWALTDLSYLPGNVYAFLHYSNIELSSPTTTQYYRHANLISLSFLVTRIIGFSLMARWLYKGGPDIEELLLPGSNEENVALGATSTNDLR